MSHSPNELPLRHCGNCGTTLHGPFCHQCGQPERSPVRELFSMARDSLVEFFSLDGKILRSFVPLLLRPGALTREYLNGRRISFIRPFRMYLGISIVLFLSIALFDDPLHFGKPRAPAPPVPIVAPVPPVPPVGPLGPGSETVTPPTPQPPTAVIEAVPPTPTGAVKPQEDGLNIQFGGRKWDPRKEILDIPYVPAAVDEFLRQQLIIVVENGRKIEEDPAKLWRSLLERLPQSLFLLLPLFALLLKLMYIFKKRLYAEHLIVALHSHSFLFLSFVLMLFGNALARLWPSLNGLATANWIILVIWMPIYLLVMQKRVYGQGWLMTLLKFGFIGVVYLVLIVVTVAIAFLLALRFMD